MSKKVYRIQDICFLVFRCPGGFASHRTDGKSVVTEEVCAKALPRRGRRPFCKKAWRKTFRIRCGGVGVAGVCTAGEVFLRRARWRKGSRKVEQSRPAAGCPRRKASAATTGRAAGAPEEGKSRAAGVPGGALRRGKTAKARRATVRDGLYNKAVQKRQQKQGAAARAGGLFAKRPGEKPPNPLRRGKNLSVFDRVEVAGRTQTRVGGASGLLQKGLAKNLQIRCGGKNRNAGKK